MFTPEPLSSFSDLEYMIYNYITTHEYNKKSKSFPIIP
jgi:hypothetical protein